MDFLSFSESQISTAVRTRLGGFEFLGEYLLYMQSLSLSGGPSPGVLESLAGCLRKLIGSYVEHDWLFPVFVYIVSLVRKTAIRMDSSASSLKWQKKIVEIFREIFPLVHKERTKLPGTCWIICQLLPLYIALDQVKLCHHILAALTQSLAREGGFNPQYVPKSVAVTLYYYWGRFHVMESKYQDAHEKLVWAFQHCHPQHLTNRKHIAEYLIPSMISIGIFPRYSMMEECGLDHYVGITNAIKTGDVGTYNNLMDSHAHSLAKSGTLVLMEKCKLLCYRNLAKQTFIIAQEISLESTKIDLDLFEESWKIAEGASKNEMICALADLIYSGAMKGYIALEFNKLVLSKANPFPKIDSIM